MLLNHRTVNVNGIDYQLVENKAKESKADLILLHGAGGNYREFMTLMRLLYREYNFIAVDLPGFGLSEALKTFSIDKLVTDIDELILSMNYKKPVLMGHSLGGVISYLIASKNEKIQKLVIYNSPIKTEHLLKSASDYATIVSKLPPSGPVADAITTIKNSKLGSDIVDKFIGNFLQTGVKKINYRYNYNYAWESVAETNLVAAIDYCKFLLDFDITDAVKNIKIPTLCFFGKEDIAVSALANDYIKQINPSIQTVMLENFDHDSILLKPERVLEYLDKFI